ncbi:hypothetical protein [Tessaracoccus palaemonis]|uniref:Lipoprotein n=1 Tax=Tessaracoccus palaemonis TaxID=2829499 RepID=A0ABX8SFN0_9ACTN|nr:hypothetical protein [Tessaracoccus palaemonis]QXT62217.1 hypothetical protein KDB89_10650 [Tessaracoccus palaemonis]
MSRRTVAMRIAAFIALTLAGCAPSVEAAPTPSTSPSPWFSAEQLALEARTAECRDIAEDLLKSHRVKEKAVTVDGDSFRKVMKQFKSMSRQWDTFAEDTEDEQLADAAATLGRDFAIIRSVMTDLYEEGVTVRRLVRASGNLSESYTRLAMLCEEP